MNRSSARWVARRMARGLVAALGLGLGLLVAGASGASAHPLGNLSVNTADGVVIDPDRVRVDHVEDLAELPALAVLRAADRDGDGTLGSVALQAVSAERCAAAAQRVRVMVDGVQARLTVDRSTAQQGEGQAGLPLLRIECELLAERPDAGSSRPVQLHVEVAPASDLGWRELTVAGDRTTVRDADVPATSPSRRLTAYPASAATDQLHQTSATALVVPGGPALAAGPGEVGVDRPDLGRPVASGPFAGELASAVGGLRNPGPATVAVLVALAGLVGAAHALAPGHGKTVLAAAMIASSGRRRRLRDAVTIAGTVTVAHTTSVVVIAGVLWALGASLPGRLVGGLEVLSGLLVVAVGVGLVRAARGPVGHGHGHGHGHDHGHDHGHEHGHGHGHGHEHPHHDGHPDRSGRRLVALGIAGGLTPSPTALVLLLSTTAIGVPQLGVLAVVAFGAGMALTLTAVGLLAGLTRERLQHRAIPAWAGRLRDRRPGRLPGLVRVASSRTVPALAVVVAGGALAVRGAGIALGI